MRQNGLSNDQCLGVGAAGCALASHGATDPDGVCPGCKMVYGRGGCRRVSWQRAHCLNGVSLYGLALLSTRAGNMFLFRRWEEVT